MAIHAPITGAPLRAPGTITPDSFQHSAFAEALRGFDREKIGSTIEALIAILDEADGDLDIEPDGDELDGNNAEDDFRPHSLLMHGPGCPISDPDLAIDDGPCDDIDQDREPEEELTPDWPIDQTEPIPDAFVIASDRQAIKPHLDRIRRTRCVPKYLRSFRTGRLEPSQHDFRLITEPIAPTRRQLLRRKRGVPRKPRA